MSNIDIQFAASTTGLPIEQDLRSWCEAALLAQHKNAELTLRIVDSEEIHTLNRDYRHKDKPTNVLSFPSNLPAELELDLLGDVVICASIVAQEAADQGKTILSHWAHMVVHGTLHLQGFDHIDDDDALEMESLETDIMKTLGFPDPYQESHASDQQPSN